MPGRDGTGPNGMGTRTGKGMGFCDINKVVVGAIGGLGCRRGFGRNNFNNKINLENQKDLLMQQKTILENRLNLVNNQLNTLYNDK